jgi:ADP-ribosyl-[dinitrogen reductase] hydrolase
MNLQADKRTGGLLGLLIGDALGVPYEFHPAEEIPPYDQIEFEPPAGYDRAHKGVPPGTWSDDGAQALCLLASLLECGRFDAEDFGGRLVRWYDEGYLAVDGNVFDVGVTTGKAIRAIKQGVPAIAAGPSGDLDNGNGSLMRVLPLALWHQDSDEELVHDVHEQSRLTHGHMRSQACCALYCLWARNVLNESPDPWKRAVASLRTMYRGREMREEELEWSLRPDDPPQGTGSGYVVDCLRSARWAVEQGGYEQAVKSAIRLGNDTDTTACVAGGIAGIRDGLSGIPERWRDNLRGRELVDPLMETLLERA